MGSASAGPVNRKSATVRIREASFRDYEQIAALESRYGLGARNYGEWSHLWLKNPAYLGRQNDWPIGWVLEDGEGRIVGSMGNVPLYYELDGKRVLVATGRSWVADEAHRSAALLLLESVINQPHIDLYLNNTGSQNALAAISALGCSRMPVGVWDQAAYWITNHTGFYQSVIAMKDYSLMKPFGLPRPARQSWTRWSAMRCRLAKPLGYPVGAMSFVKDHMAAPGWRERDIEVQSCSGFDDRFNQFWTGLTHRNPHILLAVRTREVLNWHFRYALQANRLWIATVADGARLAAYAVFEKMCKAKSGFTQIRLIDYQSANHGTGLLGPILSWALRRCRAEGIHMLQHTGQWLEKGGLLDTATPYRLGLTWAYFYRVNNPELSRALKDKRVWDPSLYDGDATL